MFKRLAVALALLAILLAPNAARAQSSADLIFADLDAYWSQQLAERGIAYSSPRFTFVDNYGQDLCGFYDAYDVIGGYCMTSNTLTLTLSRAASTRTTSARLASRCPTPPTRLALRTRASAFSE